MSGELKRKKALSVERKELVPICQKTWFTEVNKLKERVFYTRKEKNYIKRNTRRKMKSYLTEKH